MTTETYRLPPGPKTPKLLNGIAFLVAHNRFVGRLKRRYGDALTLRIPPFGQMVVVSNPELVKAVYTAKPDVLHAGEDPLGEVLGHGSLFSMDEERHLRERRMLLPPFHGDRMRSYESIIEEEALRAMAEWPEGVEFASLQSFQTVTLRIILRAVFGAEGRELAELEKLLPPMTTLGQRLVAAPILRRDFGRRSPAGRWKTMQAQYRRLTGKLVDDHLADPDLDERIDILAQMLRAQLEHGDEIDKSDLADELLTVLVAGHETTGSALAWSVERLRRHPEVLGRLEEEARGDDNALRLATAEEVLRVRPVINATIRLVKKPFEIGEWRLPPGIWVATAITPLHRDERFHARANRFEPDRYVGKKPDTYAWIPFGGGVRRCLGAAFAQFEMDIVMRTLLRNFELQPTTEPGERQGFRGVAFAPTKGGVAVVRRRQLDQAEPESAARITALNS
ncbi:MAG TPA: cytochrome P450 [Solirubrobacterales bacterium]|nr:cytochrome P450 [Solirubrobacterales bacterium]